MNYRLETDSSDYYLLEDSVKSIRSVPGIVCEIGTRRGGSLKIIIDSLLENGDEHRNVLALDPYGHMPYQMTEVVNVRLDYTNQMRDETVSALYGYVQQKPVNLVVCFLEDTEFFKRFSDGYPFYNEEKTVLNQYALVFFDGPHSVSSIQTEIEFFQSRTVLGSVYVFDDIECYPHNDKIEPWLLSNGWKLKNKFDRKASYIKV